MGMHDRDYYHEWRDKRDGLIKRPKLDITFAPRYRSIGHWHPVLLIALFVAICASVFGLLKLISVFVK